MKTNVTEKIERASAKMLLAHPWWASLYLNLRRVETTDVPTMAVDGTHLFYNPEFVESLTEKECLGVLLHETGHIALLHCYRRLWRDPLVWNIAADEKVNALLAADGIMLPEDCIPGTSLDETVEEAYDRILKNATKISLPMSDVGDPASGGPTKGEGASGEGMKEQDWKDILAQTRGITPSSFSRYVSANAEPQVDWRDILSQFVSSTRRADTHTWNRRSRRSDDMPGWRRESENTLAVCVDTSGSVDNNILTDFLSELKAICAIEGTSAHVISCDSAVHQIIPPGEPIPFLQGGGGTDFRPALEKAEELCVDAAIYFTDAQGTFPASCKVPVLWALVCKVVVPFGESILINRRTK